MADIPVSRGGQKVKEQILHPLQVREDVGAAQKVPVLREHDGLVQVQHQGRLLVRYVVENRIGKLFGLVARRVSRETAVEIQPSGHIAREVPGPVGIGRHQDVQIPAGNCRLPEKKRGIPGGPLVPMHGADYIDARPLVCAVDVKHSGFRKGAFHQLIGGSLNLENLFEDISAQAHKIYLMKL